MPNLFLAIANAPLCFESEASLGIATVPATQLKFLPPPFLFAGLSKYRGGALVATA